MVDQDGYLDNVGTRGVSALPRLEDLRPTDSAATESNPGSTSAKLQVVNKLVADRRQKAGICLFLGSLQ
jgi:hypothetical protein